MRKTGKTIRIREIGDNLFGLAIIDHDKHKVFDQGLASGARNPQQAYNYAMRGLPTAITTGAAWEYRSVTGVYADLDVTKLGWRVETAE